jgi:hypothetical protein
MRTACSALQAGLQASLPSFDRQLPLHLLLLLLLLVRPLPLHVA